MVGFLRMKKFLARLLITSLWIGASQFALFSGAAHAMDQDTRAIIRGGTYGLIGGTVVGIAVLPLTGSVRGVFIGSSLGLYMGLLMGVYHITHREDSNYQLRGEEKHSDSMDAPGSANAYFAENHPQAHMQPRTPMEMPLSARFSLSFPIMRF